jgi:hypothetical protein
MRHVEGLERRLRSGRLCAAFLVYCTAFLHESVRKCVVKTDAPCTVRGVSLRRKFHAHGQPFWTGTRGGIGPACAAQNDFFYGFSLRTRIERDVRRGVCLVLFSNLPCINLV